MPTLGSCVKDFAIPGLRILCNQATLYWMVMARRGNPPSLEELAQAGPIMQGMKECGRPLTRSEFPDLLGRKGSILPGTVLMFYFRGNIAHSCIAKDSRTLGGFNQVGWLAGGGPNIYSENNLTEIRWFGENQVQGFPESKLCQLWAINELGALQNLETLIAKNVNMAHA